MSAENPRDSGAIYVAQVQATLPEQNAVYQSYLRTETIRANQSGTTSTIEAIERHTISANVQTLEGATILHGMSEYMVASYNTQYNYVILEVYIGDDEETFSTLFSNQAGRQPEFDGNFGYHTAYESDAGLYVVPLKACGSDKPVPALAALAIGTEAVPIYDPLESEQAEALMIAADLLLQPPERSGISYF